MKGIYIAIGGVYMKTYSVIMIQLIIWSGYTFLEWLSKHDHPVYNVLMFFVFFYLAVILGNFIIKSPKRTFMVTMLSLGLYGSFQAALAFIHY
jgi:hypothetical protein